MQTKIVKFNVKPEQSETFKNLLIKHKENTKKETGLVEIRIYREKQNTNLFFIYERFQDQAAVDSHIKHAYTIKFGESLNDVLATPAEIFNLGETNPLPVVLRDADPDDDLFNIIFIFKIKEGFRESLLKQFEAHVTSTRKEEDANLLFELYTVKDDDNTLAVYEHWRNESAVWDIHFSQPYAKVTGALMEEAVVGDMKKYMNFVTEL